jgi:hypothetical protein
MQIGSLQHVSRAQNEPGGHELSGPHATSGLQASGPGTHLPPPAASVTQMQSGFVSEQSTNWGQTAPVQLGGGGTVEVSALVVGDGEPGAAPAAL